MKALFEFESSGGTSVLLPPKPRLRPLPVPDSLEPPPSGPPDDFDDGGGGGDGYGGWGGGENSGGGDDGARPRPTEGLDTGSLALTLLLAGAGSLFTVLLSVWLFLRSELDDPPLLPLRFGPVSATLMILVASLSLEHASRIARGMLAKDRPRVLGWLAFSAALDTAFIGTQAGVLLGMRATGDEGLVGGAGAVLVTLLALHALHVGGGLVYELFVAGRLRASATSVEGCRGLRLAAVFQHAMAGGWGVLFVVLYLVG